MPATWPRPSRRSEGRRAAWGSRSSRRSKLEIGNSKLEIRSGASFEFRVSGRDGMGKKYDNAVKLVDKPTYTVADAMPLVKKAAFAKFDETVELAIRLGVDPKHADQMVRGTVVLPHGLGKTKRVIVIASGDKVREGREAGADEVGGDDLVQIIRGGWLN